MGCDMGYRSEVCIGIVNDSETVSWIHNWLTNSGILTKEELEVLERNKVVYGEDFRVEYGKNIFLYFEHIKWINVEDIERFLYGKDFGMIVVGEDYGDIEVNGDPYKFGISVKSFIEFPWD